MDSDGNREWLIPIKKNRQDDERSHNKRSTLEGLFVKRWITFLAVVVIVGGAVYACRAAPISSLRTVAAGSERYVYLKDLAKFYGLTLQTPSGRKMHIRGKWCDMTFETESRETIINNTQVWLHAPVRKIKGYWSITESDAKKVVDPIIRPYAYLGGRGYKVVVLDPGHGGKDVGARGRRGVEEKRSVLDIAKRVRVHLANEGVKVYLTRDGDRFIPLEERSQKAAKWGADVFVSIHLNAAANRTPRGIETFTLAVPGFASTAASESWASSTIFTGNRFDHSSNLLGYYIQQNLKSAVRGEDRGLRRARFMVLKNAPCPAALVECGFLSNPYEEEAMLSSDHREAIARGISKGILEFVNQVKRARLANP